MASEPARRSTFETRLRDLFERVTWVDSRGRRRSFTNNYVSETISHDPSHDITVSSNTIDALRNGRNTNPTLNVIRALAKFFNDHRSEDLPEIDPGFLTGDAPGVETTDRQLLDRIADQDVRTIALRAGEADPRTRRQLVAMLEVLEADSESGSHGAD